MSVCVTGRPWDAEESATHHRPPLPTGVPASSSSRAEYFTPQQVDAEEGQALVDLAPIPADDVPSFSPKPPSS
ncbi:hypothetical protein [Streptomyces sp. bgisy154]|uniref:hypothetical protein n=1 Tax=Streptomyces sp. bgisy154 TaxID=3413794 RepID=UPI003D75AFF6